MRALRGLRERLGDLHAEIIRLLLRWRHGPCPERSWGLQHPCIYHHGHMNHAAGGHETERGVTWMDEPAPQGPRARRSSNRV